MTNTNAARSQSIMSMVMALPGGQDTDLKDASRRSIRISSPEARAEFLTSVATGASPETTARRLGLPLSTIRRWTTRLARLTAELRIPKGSSPRQIWDKPPLTGVTLVHSADTFEALPGQVVTFTSWVMNDSTEPLHGITLVPRSFTNAGMETLAYTAEPAPAERLIGTLLPGETASLKFIYRVTADDAVHEGDVISAMGVQASTRDGRNLWDECDATILIANSPG